MILFSGTILVMKQIEVSAAIIIKDNKIFITQRDYGEFKDYR